MSKWGSASPKERESAPASVFCGPGRSFPVADKEDFDNAVSALGRAKGDTGAIRSCMIRKAKANGWELPKAWQEGAKMSLLFAIESARRVEGDHAIYPMSLLFRPGDYPDKHYAMTPEEIWLAVDAFEPVTGNIEHTEFLQGRACEVRKVWMDEDSGALKGEVAVPIGLDDLLEPNERRLSCEWHPHEKLLTGMALCCNPRIPDAALMAKAAATFSGDDLKEYTAFAGRRHSGSDQQLVQTVHDHSVSLGAECPASARMSKEQGMADQKAPTRFERLMAWMAGEGADDAQFAADPPKREAQAASEREIAELKATLAGLQTAFGATAEQQRLARAGQYADAAIQANKAVPAERDALAALFAQAMADDAAHAATVTFGDGDAGKGGRLDALVALIKARPAHTLTREQVPDNVTTLFADGRDQKKPGSVEDDVKSAVEFARKNGLAKAE